MSPEQEPRNLDEIRHPGIEYDRIEAFEDRCPTAGELHELAQSLVRKEDKFARTFQNENWSLLVKAENSRAWGPPDVAITVRNLDFDEFSSLAKLSPEGIGGMDMESYLKSVRKKYPKPKGELVVSLENVQAKGDEPKTSFEVIASAWEEKDNLTVRNVSDEFIRETYKLLLPEARLPLGHMQRLRDPESGENEPEPEEPEITHKPESETITVDDVEYRHFGGLKWGEWNIGLVHKFYPDLLNDLANRGLVVVEQVRSAGSVGNYVFVHEDVEFYLMASFIEELTRPLEVVGISNNIGPEELRLHIDKTLQNPKFEVLEAIDSKRFEHPEDVFREDES